jgi:hypothetical protein
MRKALRNKIIKEIKDKKTIYALVADYAIRHKKEEEFLIECYEQAHVPSFRNTLGEELFNDLIKYNVQYNNKQKINFMNSTLTKQKTKQ